MRGLLILAVLCAPAHAGNCNAVVQKVVANHHVATANFVTNYGAAVVLKQVAQPYAYYSVGQSVIEDAQAERIARLVAKKLEAKGALRTLQPEAPLGLTILQQKCAKCHSPDSKPVVAAGAPSFFDAQGNFAASPQQMGSIGTAIKNGLMPPQPAEPLSDDDYLAVKQYLSGAAK